MTNILKSWQIWDLFLGLYLITLFPIFNGRPLTAVDYNWTLLIPGIYLVIKNFIPLKVANILAGSALLLVGIWLLFIFIKANPKDYFVLAESLTAIVTGPLFIYYPFSKLYKFDKQEK